MCQHICPSGSRSKSNNWKGRDLRTKTLTPLAKLEKVEWSWNPIQGFLRLSVLLPIRWVSWRIHMWGLWSFKKRNTRDRLTRELSPLVFHDTISKWAIEAGEKNFCLGAHCNYIPRWNGSAQTSVVMPCTSMSCLKCEFSRETIKTYQKHLPTPLTAPTPLKLREAQIPKLYMVKLHPLGTVCSRGSGSVAKNEMNQSVNKTKKGIKESPKRHIRQSKKVQVTQQHWGYNSWENRERYKVCIGVSEFLQTLMGLFR